MVSVRFSGLLNYFPGDAKVTLHCKYFLSASGILLVSYLLLMILILLKNAPGPC